MIKKLSLVFCAAIMLFNSINVFAQPDRWQQRIKYNIDVKMDVVTNKFSGTFFAGK